MTWEILEARHRYGTKNTKPTITVTGGGTKSFGDRLVINLRPLQDKRLLWCVENERVAVMIGAGEHTGQIRISKSKSGSFVFVQINKHKNPKFPTLSLILALPRGTRPIAFRSAGCDFTAGPDHIDVALPDAKIPNPVQPRAAVSDPSVPLPKAPAAPAQGFRTAATAPGMRPAVGGR